MQTFTDIHGHAWTVAVTIGTVKRVKARLGIDMFDTDSFMKQMQDFIMLCDLLYVICQDEAEKRGITDEQFGCSLAGQVLRDAREALMEAYMAFFPDPEVAAKLRVVKDKYNAVGDKMLALLEKKMPQIIRKLDSEIDSVLAEMEKQIDRETVPASGDSFTNSPE